MIYNYWQLKQAFRIQDGPLLTAFEQYCTDMRFNTRILEWSCKIKGDSFEGARFLHTSRSPEFSKAEDAIGCLYSLLFPEIRLTANNQNLFHSLRSLAKEIGEGIALGYAEFGNSADRHSEIKLYIRTRHVEAARPLIELLVPQGATPPQDTHKVMIAASLDEQGTCKTRVYYLWDRNRLTHSISSQWLDAWCSSKESSLINSGNSRTISIAFKEGRRDMIYLSVPFNQTEINNLIIKRAEPYSIAYNQLENLRWIGFSKWGEDLEARELNLYFNSSFS